MHGFDHEQYNIHLSQHLGDGTVKAAIERIHMFLLETWGIDEQVLRIGRGMDTEQAMTRSLGLARGYAELETEDMVKQRRLADVGTPDNGDCATVEIILLRHVFLV